MNRYLPSGERTEDINEYIRAWTTLPDLLERSLGWILRSMDPGYTFEDSRGIQVQLSVEQVQDILKALQGGKRVDVPQTSAQENYGSPSSGA